MTELRTRSTTSDHTPQGSAKSLLMTMLGEFVMPRGGSVWTTTIVDGLAGLGVTESNARQAIARSRDQGTIRVERRGRLARWHLTDAGVSMFTSGAERIYESGAGNPSWDHRWLVVICSIPETHRSMRHSYRTQMTFEGFGFIAPNIAVSPHLDSAESANRILRTLSLDSDAITFTATRGSLTLDADVLTSAWELETLAEQYQVFTDNFEDEHPLTAGDAFSATVLMVDAWRRFPFVDPYLPSELLTENWPGIRAREVFTQRRSDWGSAAADWFATSESELDQTTA